MPDISNLRGIADRAHEIADTLNTADGYATLPPILRETVSSLERIAKDLATVAILLDSLTSAHNVLATRLDVHLRHAPTHTT